MRHNETFSKLNKAVKVQTEIKTIANFLLLCKIEFVKIVYCLKKRANIFVDELK